MRRTKVILADINDRFLSSLSAYLQKQENIEIAAVCKNGRELISNINSLAPDIVIMDIILEEIDGISVLRECASHTRRIPFIICSELYNHKLIRLSQQNHVTGYMCKPVRLEAIHRTIIDCTQDADDGISDIEFNERHCETFIMDKLQCMGIPASSTGFPMIVSAVKKVYNDPPLIRSITKTLYPMIAEIYRTSATRVERNIRSAIKSAFSRGMMPGAGRAPTNKQLIVSLANELHRYI